MFTEISKLENEKLKFKTEIETHRECIENSFCKVFENDKTNTNLNSVNEIVQLMMKKVLICQYIFVADSFFLTFKKA